MSNICRCLRWLIVGLIIIAYSLFMAGCSAGSAQEKTAAFDTTAAQTDEHKDENEHDAEVGMLVLPDLEAADLNGAPLQVVATISIIGDVVAQVGGDAIELTTLMGPGQDPHSFEPAARDLTAVSAAHVIFVNGWDLEETLVRDLEEIGEDVPLIAISANIEPLVFGEDEHNPNEEGGQELVDEDDHHQHT